MDTDTKKSSEIVIRISSGDDSKQTFETNIGQNGSLSGLTANLHKAMKVVNEEMTKLVDEAKKGLSNDKVAAPEKEEEDADTEDDEDSNDERTADSGDNKRLKLDKGP